MRAPVVFSAFLVVLLTGVPTALPVPQAAAQATATTGQGGSGLPLPRFVSLRAGEVNLRTGPGVQYPVEWVYVRKDLPVEVIVEFETWRKIRDWEGTQGWVHQSMLSGTRMVIISGDVRLLREKDDAKSGIKARIEPGVVARLIDCPHGNGWCRIEADGFEGWLRHVDFWGAYKHEVFDQ